MIVLINNNILKAITDILKVWIVNKIHILYTSQVLIFDVKQNIFGN